MYIHRHIYAVKLKIGPLFAIFKSKSGPFFVFLFWKFYSPCRKKRIFEKQAKQQQKKTQFLKLKTGPIMLRNILGPVFNFNLDQFLTLDFFVFSGGGAETPFLVFSAKMQNWKKHKKPKKDTICEHTCANCSCQNVRFFLHFWFLLFLEFPCFSEMFLIDFQNSKNNNIWSNKNKKQQQQENKIQCKNESKVMIQKTTRQQAEKKENRRTAWKKKQTKQKENARTKYRNEKQKGRKNEKNKRDTKKEKVKKGGPKKAEKKQRETQKNEQQKCPFLGRKKKKQVFSILKRNKKQKQKKQTKTTKRK